MAMAVTQIATAAAALGWMFIEWVKHGKPSVLGIASDGEVSQLEAELLRVFSETMGCPVPPLLPGQKLGV